MEKEASIKAAEVMRCAPKFSLELYAGEFLFIKPDAERIIDALRKGEPEVRVVNLHKTPSSFNRAHFHQ